MAVLRSRFLSSFILAGLIVGLTLAGIGCGGSSSVTKQVPMTKAQIKIGDSPADSVLAFELKITRIDLVQQNGATINVLSTPSEIELTHLAGTVETLAVADVPTGTYSGASVAVS